MKGVLFSVFALAPMLFIPLLACEAPEQEPPRATAHAPEEQGENSSAEEAKVLPGSGLAPQFAPSSRRKETHWLWRYDVDYPEQGAVQDRAEYVRPSDGVVLSCSFVNTFQNIGCSLPTSSIFGWTVRLEPEPFVGAGAMAALEKTLLVVHHDAISTGAFLSAYDIESAKLLWREQLEGLGDVKHSKYRNEVQLEVDEARDAVTIHGKESSGGYVEVRRVTDGSLLSTQTFPSSLTAPHDIPRYFPYHLEQSARTLPPSSRSSLCTLDIHQAANSTCGEVPASVLSLARVRLDEEDLGQAQIEGNTKSSHEPSPGLSVYLFPGRSQHYIYFYDPATGLVAEHIKATGWHPENKRPFIR